MLRRQARVGRVQEGEQSAEREQVQERQDGRRELEGRLALGRVGRAHLAEGLLGGEAVGVHLDLELGDALAVRKLIGVLGSLELFDARRPLPGGLLAAADPDGCEQHETGRRSCQPAHLPSESGKRMSTV